MSDPRKGPEAESQTHFGYQSVPESQKAYKVAEVFHSVAAKYDVMNDLMSAGIHRLWKRFTIELSGVRRGNRVLDIAGGTGVASNVRFVQADAEKLPFPDNHFDCITIAFGLRNVTHKDQALASMLRVLKPGGRLLVLEFSKPTNPLVSKAYDAYSFGFLPLMGKLVAGDADSYRYLAESIRMHPDQQTLKAMMEETGFARVTFHNMTGGVVALHRGIKP